MKKTILIVLFAFGIAPRMFSQTFYDINTINTIEISFTQSNWDYLLDSLVANGQEERLLGTATINGQFFDSVGVRYKGNSSYSPTRVKNPLNIKLDYVIEGQLIENYGTLKLSNGFKDPTFVRETMGYEIARKYMPAGLSNYANVFINGTYLGLYTSDQDVDKFFMQTHFGSDENARIKGEIGSGTPPWLMGGVWEYFGTDSNDYSGLYVVESDFGWGELIRFLDTLNNFNPYADQVLNIDRHLWFLAFENLLVNLDSPINNPQNYYIYKDDDGRFNSIPWDLNECFGVFTMLQNGGPQNPTQLQHLDPFLNLTSSEYPVISKILNNETYRRMYVAHMKTMLEENFINGWYLTRALEIQDIIDADVQADPNKFFTYSDFINNIYNSIGGGPNSIIGITQLMEGRINYLNSLPEFQLAAPETGTVTYSPGQVSPGTEVWITAGVTNATSVFLGHRSTEFGLFEKILMYDDGNHHDGQAGDGIYGVSLIAGSTDLRYYIYAENQDAVAFSPPRAEYEYYTVPVTVGLAINEFMADNTSTVADQDGEYDDWIELFNNGTVDIPLGGYFLSDDAAQPEKWVFPDTAISAGGYLVVWADEDAGQQGLHANFKLSAAGEVILLSDNSVKLMDEVGFGPQKADTSTGRYPNGTGEFIEMFPTFGAENISGFTGMEEDPALQDASFILAQNYPNPFAGQTNIGFRLGGEDEVTLRVFSVYGTPVQTLVSGSLAAGEYNYTWQVANMPPGIYFYSITVGDQTQVKKMVIQDH
jgi:hypothetical protein